MSVGVVKGDVDPGRDTGGAAISERDALLLSLADVVSTEVSADVFLRRVVDVVLEPLRPGEFM